MAASATTSTKIGGVRIHAISPTVPILQTVNARRSYFWARVSGGRWASHAATGSGTASAGVPADATVVALTTPLPGPSRPAAPARAPAPGRPTCVVAGRRTADGRRT